MTSTAVPITQPMPPSAPGIPLWSGAVWIGAIDDLEFAQGRQALTGLAGYRTARLLVRSGRLPRGFVEVPIVGAAIDTESILDAIAALPPAASRPQPSLPPISVVLCTFDRPKMLAAALRSLQKLEYPDFEIVVVDNHPASGLTRPVVRELDDPRVRVVEEPRQGLARARNRGALAAAHPLVAFTDDDVVVDGYWLQGIATGFAAGPDVACVSGIVPSGEILSASQAYFDRRVSWARTCEHDLFSLSQHRPDEPLFPFQVSRFGTGANFALRRQALIEIGGFDEGLGIGSKSGGGEDIDIFVRVLLAGHQLAYEPSALVWHKHRTDIESLTSQITNYGAGLGAWITKLIIHPRTLAMIVRRVVPGIGHLRQVTHVDEPVDGLLPEHATLWRTERRAVFRGCLALARARLSGAKGRPLDARHRPEYATSHETSRTEES
jgi:GT2 family glycosyltransferase